MPISATPMGLPLWIYTVDLDSTLCHTEHRAHMISTDPDEVVRNRETDWDAHARACVDDTLVVPVAVLVNSLNRVENVQVHFVSGRSEAAKAETYTWLQDHGVGVAPWNLHMAPSRISDPEFWNHTTQAQYKIDTIRKVTEQVQAMYPHRQVSHVLHVDDNAGIAGVLNHSGICCLPVRTPYEIPVPTDSMLNGVLS